MTNSVIILLLKSKFQKLLLKVMKQAWQQKLITSTTLEDFILECTEYTVEKLTDELSCQYPTIAESKDYLSHLRDLYLPFCERVKFRLPFREFRAFAEYASGTMIEDFSGSSRCKQDLESYWDTWILFRDEFYFKYPLRPYYDLTRYDGNDFSIPDNSEDAPF